MEILLRLQMIARVLIEEFKFKKQKILLQKKAKLCKMSC